MLKQELMNHCNFKTRQEARQDITEDIEIFYNQQLTQAKLGFLCLLLHMNGNIMRLVKFCLLYPLVEPGGFEPPTF
jgi:hypothetical protein